jgi:hypothetical protein
LVLLLATGPNPNVPPRLQRQCHAALAKYETARLTGRGLELARRRLREVGGVMQQLAEADRQRVRNEWAAERAAEERTRCPACRERHERSLQLMASFNQLLDAMTACGCTAGRA